MNLMRFQDLKALARGTPSLEGIITWDGAGYLLHVETEGGVRYLARKDGHLRAFTLIRSALNRARQAGLHSVTIAGLQDAPYPLK